LARKIRACKNLFCLKELTRTNNKSNGYFRRFLIVPIPRSEMDPKLAEKIVDTELPGITNRRRKS
jgi:putative DNA primase/helicase